MRLVNAHFHSLKTPSYMKLMTFTIYCITEYGAGQYQSKGYSIADCYNRLSKRQKKQLQSIVDEDGNEYDILKLASELQF